MDSATAAYDAILTMQLTKRCNMECHYCFDDVQTKRDSELKPIDIEKLMSTLDKTGKTFSINFAGGEIFLVPNIVEACVELTKKHYVNFNTNLVPSSILKFAEQIDPARVPELHASLHIKELEKRNLTDTFIKHFKVLKEKGFNIGAHTVAHPSLFSEVAQYNSYFAENGVEVSYGHFIGTYEEKAYPQAYTPEELEAFQLEMSDDAGMDLYYRKGKKCNAGTNLFMVHVEGNITPCYLVPKDLGHIYDEIKPVEKPIVCSAEMCACPPTFLSKKLYEEVVGE